jgi:hypothetical protein
MAGTVTVGGDTTVDIEGCIPIVEAAILEE